MPIMLQRSWSKLVVASVAFVLCAAAIQAWRADHRDRALLTAELATTKQLLSAADSRQRDRDAQLAQTLAALDAQKRAIVSPAQIVRELQKNIPLPEPITLQMERAAPVGARFSLPRGANDAPPLTSPPPAVAEATQASPTAIAADALKSGATLQQQAASASANSTSAKSAPAQAIIPNA